MMCNAGFGIAGAIDDIAPDQMQKLMDVNYTGTYLARARRCRCSGGRAPAHHHRLVDRRQARRAVHGRLFGDEVRAGRLAECLRAELLGIEHPRQRGVSGLDRTEFFEVMSRETGTR
jgi:hypothetical protein